MDERTNRAPPFARWRVIHQRQGIFAPKEAAKQVNVDMEAESARAAFLEARRHNWAALLREYQPAGVPALAATLLVHCASSVTSSATHAADYGRDGVRQFHLGVGDE